MQPTRLSRRLRGQAAPVLEQAAAEGRAEAEAEGRARKAASRKRLTLPEGQQLAAPFTLWSIGGRRLLLLRCRACTAACIAACRAWVHSRLVCAPCHASGPSHAHATRPPWPPPPGAGVTVWELGRLHRGAWAHRYWSNPGCLYHHAYPVGYRATKAGSRGSLQCACKPSCRTGLRPAARLDSAPPFAPASQPRVLALAGRRCRSCCRCPSAVVPGPPCPLGRSSLGAPTRCASRRGPRGRCSR